MNVTYLVVILVAIASSVGYRGHVTGHRDDVPVGRFGAAFVAVACVVTLASFALSLHIDARAVAHQVAIRPQPPFWHVWDDGIPAPLWISDAALLVALVQSVALYAIYRLTQRRSGGWRTRSLVGGTSLGMLLLAAHATTLKSADLYAYAGIARLGFASYVPHAIFGGEYAAINHYWGTWMVPNVYGPLWTIVSHAVARPEFGIVRTMLALRGIEIVAFIAIAMGLYAMKLGDGVVAVFALNGAIVDQFIRDGHNDLFAIALVIAAMVLARFPAIAIVLVGGAIAIKISFVTVGTMVFVRYASLAKRLLCAGAAIVLGCGVTLATVGTLYLRDLADVARRVVEDAPTHDIHMLAFALVLLACAVALALRKFAPGISYAYISLGLLPLPWYVVWGFPYAIRSGVAGPFLVSLPFVLSVLSVSYAFTPLRAAIFFIAMAIALVVIVRAVRNGDFVRFLGSSPNATR